MCTFTLHYTDEKKIVCEHVKSAAYPSSASKVSVSEENLATHTFDPVRDLWLFTENGSFCICHNNLRYIEVAEE